jgi:hypothetical protein
MKKLNLIILLGVLQLNVSSQNYFSLPNTKAIWTVFHYSQFGTNIQKFGMFGDTIINSLSYKKIYEDWAPTFNINNASYRGAIREINKKIFIVHFTNNSETLLYDFNLNVGDTAKIITYTGWQYAYKVASVDSINLNGLYHKRWKFNQYNPSFHYEEYWIEGIGSSFGLLSPLWSGSDNCFNLLCASQDSSLIYQYLIPANPDCYWPIAYDCEGVLNPASVHELTFENTKSIIFPNPFSSSAILKTSIELNNATLKVYDILGQEVLTNTHLNGQEIKIIKGNLNSGNYYYHLTQNGSLISNGKFIVE